MRIAQLLAQKAAISFVKSALQQPAGGNPMLDAANQTAKPVQKPTAPAAPAQPQQPAQPKYTPPPGTPPWALSNYMNPENAYGLVASLGSPIFKAVGSVGGLAGVGALANLALRGGEDAKSLGGPAYENLANNITGQFNKIKTDMTNKYIANNYVQPALNQAKGYISNWWHGQKPGK